MLSPDQQRARRLTACPVCGAAPGEPCHGVGGNALRSVDPARVTRYHAEHPHGGPRAGSGGARPGSGAKPRLNPRRAQIAVRLPVDVADAYRALCAAEGITPSDDLRQYVEGRLLNAAGRAVLERKGG